MPTPEDILGLLHDPSAYYGGNDDYQQSARGFLDRIYPRHVKIVVQSLAALIDRLHADVARPNNPVQRIREVMIVGHASVHLMFLEVFDTPPQGQKDVFATVNAVSLFEFQRLVRAGGPPVVANLEHKRKEVVARITEESFVTLRGCRFGQGRRSLFALYAFFGGRANVYAPKSYMLFVRNHPVAPDLRFEGEADVYEHMAAQRLVRPRRRTPLRQLSLINLVSEPGSYSRDAIVRSVTLSDGDQAAEDYLADVASLQAGHVPQSIRNALAAEFDIAVAGSIVEIAREDSERPWRAAFAAAASGASARPCPIPSTFTSRS